MNKKYEVIYADPPWSYKFNKPTASKGGAKGDGYSAGVNYYYDTMTMQEIKEMPVNEISDKNAVLFMWATNPLLPEALETMKACRPLRMARTSKCVSTPMVLFFLTL